MICTHETDFMLVIIRTVRFTWQGFLKKVKKIRAEQKIENIV